MELQGDVLAKAIFGDAMEVVEWSREAFHLMFDEEDVPEETAEFMEIWNSGNTDEFTEFLNRWFSNDASIAIASKLKERQSTHSSLKICRFKQHKSFMISDYLAIILAMLCWLLVIELMRLPKQY
ncbi:hypothetical protein G7062_06780 [Erysipelothrix sp. HDW6C]|uniref:hypothetical protein n=1 Tax=Erysipelothrix sp. HDW6C TaxID=2714930 RepID=UPI00140ADD0C|nr:hypothetical protein [Erysipelothrix sp. HDW6C]QIK70006.1 hypothetical protein G7062_06780 [Erysipelothrix sp. HDW6C]